ncbi:hypothetical protein [Mycoplana dimorpha]|uniref:Lipoprotein n=1 Tax=Mycoplana dimorpha TaxID=28320 RepID=A0A2T5B102_MYCDI|nr:hypothetical protein [Mycoplana dimorpha]PTM92653.1 hypothetical protein C7449_10766 [Mycoplana dimorpha]
MHELKSQLALAGLLLTLAGCNSTDALIPQVDVGGGLAPSSPVTQRDLDQMSAETRPIGSAQATAMASSGRMQTAGTLEAQADALARNEANPVASGDSPYALAEAPGPAKEPGRQQAAEEPAGEPARQPARTRGTTEAAALTPATDGESIRFLPIIGAPVEAVTPLSRQLGAQARAKGLTIKSSSDNTSRYILKGYFSAMADGGKTTVVYVWDVLDGSGARLHRIQGQDSVAATAKDPWAAVPPGMMEAIAQRTIEQYLSWRRQGGG